MKLACIMLLFLISSCRKTDENAQITGNPQGGIKEVGGAEIDNKASGKNCKDTVFLLSQNFLFSGYTFYVDSGYVKNGNGIVAAIDGSPQIRFNNDSTYSIIKDSTSYFPSYLSKENKYKYDKMGVMSFNSYTAYNIIGYKLCGKTEVYSMIQPTYNNLYNRLVIYRNY